jgi:hypothetical protein
LAINEGEITYEKSRNEQVIQRGSVLVFQDHHSSLEGSFSKGRLVIQRGGVLFCLFAVVW